MAVDVCSPCEVLVSPRISFSHDITDQSDESRVRSDQFLPTTFDFDFNFDACVPSHLVHQVSSADELFSDGKILPTQIKTSRKPNHPDPPPPPPNAKRLKELLYQTEDDDDDRYEKPVFRAFWRSVSLNSDNGRGPKGLLRSLSLKRLSRSYSAGSTAAGPKRNTGPKEPGPQKETGLKRSSSLTQTATTTIYYSYNGNSNNSNSNFNCSRRPSLKKNSRGDYGGGIKINPILNIPSAYYISKGAINLFGLGSLFCNGKTKKKTK